MTTARMRTLHEWQRPLVVASVLRIDTRPPKRPHMTWRGAR